MRSRYGALVACGLVAGVLLTAPAHAGVIINHDRWASPTGVASGPCGSSAPCDLATAVNSAPPNSGVTVEPGIYGQPAAGLSLSTASTIGISIHGQDGRPAPEIYLGAPVDLGGGSELSGVDLIAGSSDAIDMVGGSIDHVFAVSSTGIIAEGTVSDTVSVATASGAGAFSIRESGTGATKALRLINDTAIETNSLGVGLLASAYTSGTAEILAVNTVAYGRGYSTAANNYDPASKAIIKLVHSDWTTDHSQNVASSGGTARLITDSTDVRKPPKFVHAAGGNYRETASSPTVNRGADDSDLSATDLAGQTRILGSHIDIGAFELAQRPGVSRVTVTKRSKHSVTVTARINPERLATTAKLVTTRHGTTLSSHAVSVGRGASARKETFTINGLARRRSYSMSVVATSHTGHTTVTVTAKTR